MLMDLGECGWTEAGRRNAHHSDRAVSPLPFQVALPIRVCEVSMNNLLALLVLLLLVSSSSSAFAQQASVAEIQIGGGYVHDSGEGPSVEAVNLGAVFWLTRNLGVGGRFTSGIRDDHFNPPRDAGDRTFLGLGSLRHTAVTIELRGFEEHGIELNIGLGFSNLSFEDQTIITGVRLANGEIVPRVPVLTKERIGTGAIRTEFLVGHPLKGSIGMKGGFILDLTGDTHPFQPVVLLTLQLH